jgi:hypothetical protein
MTVAQSRLRWTLRSALPASGHAGL